MSRGVGLELNGTKVRVLVLDGGRRPRIVSFAEVPLAPDERPWEARAKEAVQAAMAKAGASRGRVAASLDTGEVVLRELSIPFKADDQIRKTVPFELESLVHNYAIEDLIVDYVRGAENEKGVDLLVAGVPRKLIDERLKLLDSAGADPAILDLDATALFNAPAATGAIDPAEPVLLVYGGSRFTKLVLVEGGRPRSIRTIRFSVQAEVPPAPGGDMKDTSTGQPSPIVVLTETQWERHTGEGAAGSEALAGILAREVSRFLLAAGGTVAPAKMLLAGDLDPDALGEALTRSTGIPVETLDLLGKVDHPFGSDRRPVRQIPVALGLALKAADLDKVGTDFRRGEFSYAKKFDAVKSTGLVAVYLALMLLGLASLHHWFELDDHRRALEEVHRCQAMIVADAIKHNPDAWPEELKADPSRAREVFRKAHEGLKTEVGEGDHPIERSALDLGAQIWKALQMFYQRHGQAKYEDQGFYASIDSVQIGQSPITTEEVTVSLQGVIRNAGFADALKKTLRSVDPFNDPAWQLAEGAYTPDKEGVRFSFTLKRGKK